jgi:hypothetical protein
MRIIKSLITIAGRYRTRNKSKLNEWVLRAGVWDDTGKWVDSAKWEISWFLVSGVWNDKTYWSDGVVW